MTGTRNRDGARAAPRTRSGRSGGQGRAGTGPQSAGDPRRQAPDQRAKQPAADGTLAGWVRGRGGATLRVPGARTWLLAAVVSVVGAVWVAAAVEPRALRHAATTAASHPLELTGVLVVYGLAFAVRAGVWRRVLPELPLGQALAALHVALAGNHLLPLRLGEPLRVISVMRRTTVPVRAAIASTVTLRAADLLAVTGLALGLGAPIAVSVAGPVVWAAGLVALTVAAGGLAWLVRLARDDQAVRLPGPVVAAGTAVSWVLEAAVIWAVAHWAGVGLSVPAAIVVTAVTVAAQIAAVAPGGFGTYEAAATAVLAAVGVPAGAGLAVALSAHAVKTAYAVAAGAVAVFVPRPGMLGRLRFPAPPSGHRSGPPPAPDAAVDGERRPVVLFLPAHDEQASVAAVVGRTPTRVCGHPVETVVVDDGSVDDTARRAADAGAQVIRHSANRGLGSAVRTGLAAAVARRAAAVAFCDADGEYAPEELARLVAPILAGQADYVVGSRFAGDTRRMLAHRRLGNLVLTRLLRWVVRRPITDGQSGYRALSVRAAAAAEIVHDYNYAQVLTLDLLAKGFSYAEVPISYRFREHGRSFVRVGAYLRAVIPAVYRMLNPPGGHRR